MDEGTDFIGTFIGILIVVSTHFKHRMLVTIVIGLILSLIHPGSICVITSSVNLVLHHATRSILTS